MTQAISKKEAILEQIASLTPQQQQEVLDFIEFLQYKANMPNIAMEDPLEETKGVSFLEAAKKYIGCVDSGSGDLSLKKKELKQGYRKICQEKS